MAEAIQLIVGLGNPGPDYQYTRHNAGMWLVDSLAEIYRSALQLEAKFHGRVARIQVNSQSIWLLAPTTYMNLSGQAVKAISQFYKIPASSILVAHDELDFPAGLIRLKQGGGHGGHNGLRDIIKHLSTPDFLRLRIGIGHPGHRDKVHSYVLSRPARTEFEKIISSLQQAIDLLPNLATGNIEKAMQTLHTST